MTTAYARLLVCGDEQAGRSLPITCQRQLPTERPRVAHRRVDPSKVGELLAGKSIDMPPLRQVSRAFRRAPSSRRQDGAALAQVDL